MTYNLYLHLNPLITNRLTEEGKKLAVTTMDIIGAEVGDYGQLTVRNRRSERSR